MTALSPAPAEDVATAMVAPPAAQDRRAGDVIVAETSSHHRALAPIPTLRARRREDTHAAPAAPAPRARPRAAVAVACAAALACLTLAGRDRIVAKIPAADRVFAAIGLPVNLDGVEFRGVVSKVAELDGQKVLAVTGDIVNLRGVETTLPGLRLTVRGADGRSLYVWTAQAAASALAPGQATTFRTRLAAPPDEGRDVVVSLADPVRRVAQAERVADPGKSRTRLSTQTDAERR